MAHEIVCFVELHTFEGSRNKNGTRMFTTPQQCTFARHVDTEHPHGGPWSKVSFMIDQRDYRHD